jgi:hypothetical protein
LHTIHLNRNARYFRVYLIFSIAGLNLVKIYLSSTYTDLKACREAVYDALRQMRHDVIAMEDYVATDERPIEKCLADVVDSDLYIGIFAWRYGYIPSEMNPEHKSITELEYRKATQEDKTCLIFILDKGAPWPPTAMDAVTGEGNRGECIIALRDELVREKTVKFFKTPEELASSVSTSVNNWEKSSSLTQKQKQGEWAFVRKVVGQRMAACMVDILRLCCVRWSSIAYSSNVSRYGEFVHIAQMHFADLRSSIGGLALGAEPSDYEFARKMELRIGWMIDKFETKPEFPQEPPQWMHSIVLGTHKEIHQFLVAESGIDKVSKIVSEIEPSILDKTSIDDMNNFFFRRMAAQNELLKLQERSGSPAQGIWFDLDQELALGYFAIDSILLREWERHLLSP